MPVTDPRRKEAAADGPPDVWSECTALNLGAYRLVVGADTLRRDFTGKHVLERVRQARSLLPAVYRFVCEVYALEPLRVPLYGVLAAISSVDATLKLYLTNQLLNIIEAGIFKGDVDRSKLYAWLACRLLCIVAVSLATRASEAIEPVLQHRTRLHFEYRSLKANLRRDFASVHGDPDAFEDASEPLDAWATFTALHDILQTLVSAAAELALAVRLAHAGGLAAALGALGLLRVLPVFEDVQARVWASPFCFYATNADFRRMEAFKQMAASPALRQDIVSANLAGCIADGFLAARRRLGDTLTAIPWLLIKSDPLLTTLLDVADDWPLLLYVIQSLMQGAVPCSFSTILSLQGSAETIQGKMRQLFGRNGLSFSRTAHTIKDFYSKLDAGGETEAEAEAELAMAPVQAPADAPGAGMSLEFRDVEFTYPGSQSAQPAVRGVTFSVAAGQLVAVVGANGSGKTSLVKLLTGLYAPSAGRILADGAPLAARGTAALRDATAVLAQTCALFPLSVAENIGLGRPEEMDNRDAIEEAARKGGASEFIARLEDGFGATLTAVATKKYCNGPLDGALKAVYDGLEKSTELSGGELQRLAAARAFMRLGGGNIRLVVVDEPTSAMDPLGEFELFEKLRAEQAGKTMIFITHRYGHLTKHADAILCMKDGRLVEQGTHDELMAARGEYHELYSVQARAFCS